MTAKRFTPSKLAVLLDVALEAGLDPAAVLAGTELDVAATGNPFTLTSPLQFLTAARNAVRAYPGSDLGLRVGSRLHATSYGMLGYALLCAETLSHTFDLIVRYHRLANGMTSVRWTREGDLASWTFAGPDSVRLPNLDDALYRFLIEMQVAVHASVVKDAMGPWCAPVRTSLAFPEPPDATLWERTLGCPVAFDQPRHALSYPAIWLSKAPQMASPTMAAQMSVECAKLLDELRWQAGVTQQVYRELTCTPGRFPDIDAIAATLRVTTRTLRRKLEAEGTSYSELLASVRKALAIDYLSTTLLSTEDIAGHLGFSDPVSFRHAFRRWTGNSPREFRQRRQPD
ncbi:AraC family transcriptional regulator [Variovorax sp. ZS18.2.2]|nr:AraC family transcriptional regulator [Variovorax sp. ZS18.2.2]MCR6476128.1 AraC family transcriptional regulator [Variovorax sp. ZS18.2.2]